MLKEKCVCFGQCGGCVWQDLSEQDYIAKKNHFIQMSFQDVGLDVSLEPMILVPTGTRRRASFSFMPKHMGFNELKSHRIVDIQSCPLLLPKINHVLPVLRQALVSLNVKGNVFVSSTTLGLDIHIKTNQTKTTLAQLEVLSELAERTDIVRVVYNETPVFEKAILGAMADSFAQPSLEGEKTLIHLVLKNINSEEKVVDLFCGAGTFTKPLLGKGGSVKGYDCSEVIHSLGECGEQRDLFRNPVSADELQGVDVAILDPPRAGALAQVEQLANSTLHKIIMISCNPKTAARDAKILVDHGWQMGKVIPIDQFTYSNHIEIFTVFHKDSK